MNTKLSTLFVICVALALGPSMAHAQGSTDSSKKVDSDWVSYRDAYKAMVWFEKYGKSKNLIQNRFQIVVKDKAVNFETVRLTLNTKNSALSLTLDSLGQTQLPLLTAAYNENAEIHISPKLGSFSFRSMVSIQLRQDGNYDIKDLRSACEQTLNYLSYIDPSSVAGKKCVGVRFGFDKKETHAAIDLKASNGALHTLPLQESSLIWPDSNISLRVGQLRFDTNFDKSHLITRSAPLVAVAVIE